LSDVISLRPEQIEAAIARIKAEKERRLVEKVEAGEIVSVPLFVVAGSETEARTKVEQAKADKLAELRAAGDQREVMFSVTMAVTGVCRHGEATGVPWKPMSPPSLPTHLPTAEQSAVDLLDEVAEAIPEEPPPPIIETYVQVQVRQCLDGDDPGEVAEGWFSTDGKFVTVTDSKGREIGSRAMLEGEDARVVAKQLLREKVPESETFNRRLIYPSVGLA
jgi:hypothetical protein